MADNQAELNALAIKSMQHPLRKLCTDWLGKIDIATKVKEDVFGKYAKEASNFYDGPHDHMWTMLREQTQAGGNVGMLDKAAPFPRFRMSVNKIFDAVAIFGPSMYYQNPTYTVTHLKMPVPPVEAFPGVDPMLVQQMLMMQMQQEMGRAAAAEYIEHYLHWLIREGGLKEQARMIIEEALIKGLGCAWIDMYETPDGKVKYPIATYMSSDDLVVDPDATEWSQVQWIARRRREAVNMVERKFNLPPGSLRGQRQSGNMQGTDLARVDGPGKQSGEKGDSYDLIEYYEVYSKNGFGQRLKASTTNTLLPSENGIADGTMDMEWLGDYARIVVSPGIPFPLNAPSWALQDQEGLKVSCSWQTPFFLDGNLAGGWPLVRFYFYGKPNSVWPVSIFKPVMGPLRFVNWILSFLADKISQSCTTYVVLRKAAAVEFKRQVESGSLPFTKVEIGAELAGKLEEIIKFIDAPEVGDSIWKMAAEAMELIDKGTGLTELVYGLSSRQMRSAAEANNKNQSVSVRPDDMANKVEEALSITGMKLIECARWNITGQDVIGPLGDIGATLWDQQILMDPVDSIVRDYSYVVTAGSARRRNKQEQAAKIQEFGQIAVPVFQAYGQQTGDMRPINAYLTDWCKANDLDPTQYQMTAPLPPPMPPQGAGNVNEQGSQDGAAAQGDSSGGAEGGPPVQ